MTRYIFIFSRLQRDKRVGPRFQHAQIFLSLNRLVRGRRMITRLFICLAIFFMAGFGCAGEVPASTVVRVTQNTLLSFDYKLEWIQVGRAFSVRGTINVHLKGEQEVSLFHTDSFAADNCNQAVFKATQALKRKNF